MDLEDLEVDLDQEGPTTPPLQIGGSSVDLASTSR